MVIVLRLIPDYSKDIMFTRITQTTQMLTRTTEPKQYVSSCKGSGGGGEKRNLVQITISKYKGKVIFIIVRLTGGKTL